jgi:Plant transposon protein
MEDNDDTQISVFSDAEFHQAIGIYVLLECELQLQADRDNAIAFEKLPKKKLRNRQSTAPRRAFDHRGAYNNIERDYLGPDPLFGKEFTIFFRLTRPRIELLIQAFGNTGDPFYQSFRCNRYGLIGPCLEAKILLPVKVLAYGVAPHAFSDYFQMSITQAGVCCRKFNQLMPVLFETNFIRSPSPSDLYSINALHRRVHNVNGMLGSLDCMHTYWKNCPVAWQQSFQGKEAGHNLWFWHTSYGYAGSLNDLNILNLSPLLDKVTNGSFTMVEEAAKVVPYNIGTENFNKMYVLVDGIYPKYSRFVLGYKEPITDKESRFTAWQESARKDIERAFGVLQCKWKAIAFPIHSLNLSCITNLVATCIILHNMCVSDRVMGNVNERYVASTIAMEEHAADVCDAPTNMECPRRREGKNSISEFNEVLATTIAKRSEWKQMKNPTEWARLQNALIRLKGNK